MPGPRAAVFALACALSLPAVAQSGWYGFGSFVRSTFDGGGAPSRFSGGDDKDNGARIGAGYMFGESMGVEAGWVDFGKAKRGGSVPGLSADRDGDVRANGPFLAGIASIPLSARLSAFGRLGVIDARIDPSPDADAGIAGFFESTSDWRPMIGIGGAWRITHRWSIQTEYGEFARLGNTNREVKVSMLSVGMTFRLG